MKWIFEESNPMGGAAGEAFANTLKSPGMRPEHVLAREAIQNSVDAGIDGKVLVRFNHKQMIGAAKQLFVEASGLTSIASRAAQLSLASPNCLLGLEKPKTPLSLLYVEDHDAEGLSGDPHDSGSNFYRLLLSLGDRSKARTGKGTGGSYGFGKSVYSSSSAIQTIFAHTRFVGKDGSERTRIFGCGYYASHDLGRVAYSGRAWFGSKNKAESLNRSVVDPLDGVAADKLAYSLGFSPRGPGDLGTTILIVDAYMDLNELVRGVEDWWWPRLIENKLDVEVIDPGGFKQLPRPRKNEALRPFIDAFEIARQRAEPKNGVQKFNRLNNLGDIPLGACGFVVVPLTDNGPVVKPDRCNSVALIRAPLMVVSYKSCSETEPLVVGAFVASDDVDPRLRQSEPPAHDRWDPDSANLRDEKGLNKEVVRAILSRIRFGLKRFQSDAAPPTPAKQRRLSLLERALGSYFRPQGAGPGGPSPKDGSPLHLEFVQQPHAIATPDGRLRMRGAFTVMLDKAADEDDVELRLRLNCPVLEDDGQEGDDLAVTIKTTGVKATADKQDSQVFRFPLSKTTKAHFEIESEPYDSAWTVRLRPEIDREEAE